MPSVPSPASPRYLRCSLARAAQPGPHSAGRQRPGVIPLTILCGFDRHAVADIAAALLLAGSRLALVWADPFTADLGFLQTRVTDSDGRCTDQTVSLGRGFVSRALDAAVARAVRRLRRTGRYDAILIHLHPGIEADAAIDVLSAELSGVAVVDTVALYLHPGWLDNLSGDATARAMRISVTGADSRFAAPILASDLTAATVVIAPAVAAGVCDPAEGAVLSILAPDAVQLHPATPLDVPPAQLVHTGRFELEMLDPLAPRGLLDAGLALPAGSGTLRLVRWAAGRPVHPQRLHDAIGELADGVIRSTGFLRFATRSHQVVLWDSAGSSLILGLPDTAPADQVGASRLVSRARPQPRQPARDPAGLSWPVGNHLAFLGDSLSSQHIQHVLNSCLLTDAELAGGPAGWRQLNDPFPRWEADDEARAASRPPDARGQRPAL